jgi:hypothetical protein
MRYLWQWHGQHYEFIIAQFCRAFSRSEARMLFERAYPRCKTLGLFCIGRDKDYIEHKGKLIHGKRHWLP